MRLHASGDPWISDVIRRDGVFEPLETRVFSRLVSRPIDVYDVGANIGWYTLIAAHRLGSAGRVFAFEPCAANAAVLAYNAAANGLGNVSILPFALGAETGSGALHLSATNPGDHRAFRSPDEVRISSRIAIERFDTWFDRGRRKPVLVKIDTQGFEFDVLTGMGRYLSDSSLDLILLIEFWPYGLAQRGSRAGDVLKLMEGYGFTPMVINENEPCIRSTSFAALEAAAEKELAPGTQYFVNLLLHRDKDLVPSVLTDLHQPGPSWLVPDV